MIRKGIIPLVLAAGLAGGCDALRQGFYVLWPGAREKTVEAEFKDLPGKTVAVLVFADKAVGYEYPQVRINLSAAIADQLRRNVKNVQVIDPRRTVKYQDENLYWEEMDKTDLGKAFGADYLLYVSLVEFSTREPGSLHLYRGRAKAEVAIYATAAPERQARARKWDDLQARYPPDTVVGMPSESDQEVRDKLEQVLAEAVARKFHQHKVPLE